MSELSGPLSDTFLEIYLDHYYRKAKKMQARARSVGITLDQLTIMAMSEGVETVDFKLNLIEEQNGTKISG